jgi:hypothetical protein
MSKASVGRWPILVVIAAALALPGAAQAAKKVAGIGIAIGEACQGIIHAHAANPIGRNTWSSYGFAIIEAQLTIGVPTPSDKTTAIGMIRAERLRAWAQNPILRDEFAEIEAACELALETGVIDPPTFP